MGFQPRYSVCTPGHPNPVEVLATSDLTEAVEKCVYPQEVWDWTTGKIVHPVYPIAHSTSAGTWVVYSSDHAVEVTSQRIRAARFAINTTPPADPDADFQRYQTEVMEPLHDELRAALRERTDELLGAAQ